MSQGFWTFGWMLNVARESTPWFGFLYIYVFVSLLNFITIRVDIFAARTPIEGFGIQRLTAITMWNESNNTREKTVCLKKMSWILTAAWMQNSNWVLRLPMIYLSLFFFIYKGTYEYDCYKFQRLIMELPMGLCKMLPKLNRIRRTKLCLMCE